MSDINFLAAEDGETFSLAGLRIRVLEDGSRTDRRLGMVEITVPPRAAPTPQHFHRMHDETFLVTRGSLRFTTGDRNLDVATGGYIVVPTHAPHTFSNPFDEPAVFINSFAPSYYVDYLRDLARLAAEQRLNPETVAKTMAAYATSAV